jgi:hypothetical protein
MLIKDKLTKVKICKILTFIFFISFYFSYNVYANPTQIIKNVICKESSIMKSYLEKNQNEKLAWLGVAQNGSTITELYISKTTNTWTILETDTKGISCATIGGKDSRLIE